MHPVSKDVRRKVLKLFGKTEEAAFEDVKHVEDWLKTQQIPEAIEDVKILNFLQLNKFDLDKTKEKIGNYYTFRSKYPEFFTDCNPKQDWFTQFQKTTIFSVQPKALDDIHRVFYLKSKEANAFDAVNALKVMFAIYELRLYQDCMVDDIFVVDCENITLKDVLRAPPLHFFKSFKIYKDVFAMRLKAAYFINCPWYISMWITVFRLILKKKIIERFQVHSGAEIMKEVLPVEELPGDYGGEGTTLEELNEMLKVKFEEFGRRFDQMDKLVEK